MSNKWMGTNSFLYFWQKLKVLLGEKAGKDELHSHENKVELDKILTGEVEQWRNMVATGIPEFPNQSTLDSLGTSVDGKLTLNGVVVDTNTTYDLTPYAKSADVYSKEEVYAKTEVYTKDELDGRLSSAMRYKGTVQSYATLPTNAEIGDTYNITEESEHNVAGDNAVWNGTTWDILSGMIDTSSFLTMEDASTNEDIDTILES